MLDQNNTTLKFYVCDDLSADLDIPIVERQGSLTQRMTNERIREVVQALTTEIVIEAIADLTFLAWR
ncbi:MAG: hypothetical protein F6J87_11570 [Spirulina sp. SIO3F2]|nr:hypothetical protein [Spirulina sp. SIO3F2]